MVYRKTNKVKKKMDGKKEGILRAAKETLAEKSYKETSIKTITKKAGIAAGTFYLYFSNKETLVETVIEEMYQDLLDEIKKERSKYDYKFDKLKASMEACLNIFIKEKHLAKILLLELPVINNAFNKKLTEIEKELIALTREDLDELQAENLLPEQDTLVSAAAFVGTFRQVLINWLEEGEPQDLKKAFGTLMQYNFRGLGKISDKDG